MRTPSRDFKPVILKIPLIKVIFVSFLPPNHPTNSRSPISWLFPCSLFLLVSLHNVSRTTLVKQNEQTKPDCVFHQKSNPHTQNRVLRVQSVPQRATSAMPLVRPRRISEVTGPHPFGAMKSGKRYQEESLEMAEWNLVPQPTHTCKLHTATISPNQESQQRILGKMSKFAGEKNGLK